MEVVEASEAVESNEVNEAAEAWKIPNEDFRVIRVFEFSFILMFRKEIFFW